MIRRRDWAAGYAAGTGRQDTPQGGKTVMARPKTADKAAHRAARKQGGDGKVEDRRPRAARRAARLGDTAHSVT